MSQRPSLCQTPWQEATGRESDVEPQADIAPLVASVTYDNAITDLGRVEYEDPTLAVDSLGEFFAPKPVAPITRIVEELVPPGLESCLSDRQSSAEIRRAAVEFQRFAEMFHAFATDIQQR